MVLRNIGLTLIQIGIIALIVGVVVVYLSAGLPVWKTVIVLILMLLLIVGEIVDGRRTRKLEEENKRLQLELKGWELTH